MAANWDALVLNDYEAVMPLTWKRKYGINYLYQPFCTAALGLFGSNITARLLELFLAAIPAKFRYWDIYLNHGNLFTLQRFELYQRMNFVLPLQGSYENIAAKFSNNIKRNIKKSIQLECYVEKDFPVNEVISIAKSQSSRLNGIAEDDYDRFQSLYQQLHENKMAITYGIRSALGELLASCVFFFSHNRAFYILVGNHPNGRTLGASHALINAFIKDYSESNLLLDFEGSDMRNLAYFYSSFGAYQEKFTGIKYNRLPAIIKWMKN
jgi:hypothetical protein